MLDLHDAPGLIAGIRAHPGIGHVLVRGDEGLVALGRLGEHHLGTGRLTGEDPLAPYGPHAAASLQRLAGFSNSGDVIVLSPALPGGEVIPIEELTGSHGGLGGAQTEAFLLHPAGWSVDGALVGAPAVNRQLVR